MIVVEKKPVPVYEVTCSECGSKIQYKKSEVFSLHICCPVCGISIWADTIWPVRMEEASVTMKKDVPSTPTVTVIERKV